jgi:uncharacterized protein (TIGR02757 family)
MKSTGRNIYRTDEMRCFLDEKADKYNRPEFIADDPIQIPHRFTQPENIEISGFLITTIAWGQRKTIIRNALHLMSLMDNNPYDYLMNAREEDYRVFQAFRHRTFNGQDCIYFLKSLKNIYSKAGGLGKLMTDCYLRTKRLDLCLIRFRDMFLEGADAGRTAKHIPDITHNSAAKRLNLYLRWMVRKDGKGVDFGLWDQIPMSDLYIPLDIHTGRIARMLGLLGRRANDWKAVEELTGKLRQFDPHDPVKYDFALYGTGVYENF